MAKWTPERKKEYCERRKCRDRKAEDDAAKRQQEESDVVKKCCRCGLIKPIRQFGLRLYSDRRSIAKFHRSCGVCHVVRHCMDCKGVKARKSRIKTKAQQEVQRAIYSGVLVKQPCIVCGNQEAFAHHSDYSKPLDVDWMCRYHHSLWHRYHEAYNC
jgi:hypothetical protein